jgi:hypothetical protein
VFVLLIPFNFKQTDHFLLAQVGPRPNNTGTLNNTHIQDFTFQNFVGVVRECVTVSYLPFGRNH